MVLPELKSNAIKSILLKQSFLKRKYRREFK